MNWIKRTVEAIIFNSRWLVAPFLLGLIVGLAVLLYKFIINLGSAVAQIQVDTSADLIVRILNLISLVLIANLIVIVICATYENFIARTKSPDHPNLPEGLLKIGFSGLKQKLLGSIVAIAAVNVLRWFMDIDQHADSSKLAWLVGILIAFSVAILLLAI